MRDPETGRRREGEPAREPPVQELSELDPTAETGRFDAAVAGILEAAGPELARRRTRDDPLGSVAVWWRPTLAAAAATALVSAALLAGVERAPDDGRETRGVRPVETASTSGAGVSEALGVPDALTGWIAYEGLPGPGTLVLQMEGNGE